MKKKLVPVFIIVCLLNNLVSAQPPGPNLYTWFEGITSSTVHTMFVDIRIDSFPPVTPAVLYFWAFNTQFSDGNWAHMGLQWTGQCLSELGAPDPRCANWGGSGGRSLIYYPWEVGVWYRYTVKKLTEYGQNPEGTWTWGSYIYNYINAQQTKIGDVLGGSSIGNNIAYPGINNPLVFTETGYGVNCSTECMKVTWRNPTLNSSDEGESSVPKGLADYNTVCNNTNQEMIASDEWIHETNTQRNTPAQTFLWGGGVWPASGELSIVEIISSVGIDNKISGDIPEDVTVRFNDVNVTATVQYCGVNSNNGTTIHALNTDQVKFEDVTADNDCIIVITATRDGYLSDTDYIYVADGVSANEFPHQLIPLFILLTVPALAYLVGRRK